MGVKLAAELGDTWLKISVGYGSASSGTGVVLAASQGGAQINGVQIVIVQNVDKLLHADNDAKKLFFKQ